MKKAAFILSSLLLINFVSAQSWKEVKAGSEFSLGLKDDGTLWSWGFNGNGQLGILTENTEEPFPVQVGNDDNWRTISAGGHHVLAIKNDGTLWGWGFNGFGQVTGEDEREFYTPQQIGTDTDWKSVDACYVSSFALKNDGTLWAWGYNGNGQLGLNDFVLRSQPTQVGTATWKIISAGGTTTMGIQDNNTLWRWGMNANYSSTDGYIIWYDTLPTQVGTDTDWGRVSVGIEFAMALKTDGSLWMYGDNTNKQLGYDTVYGNDFFQIASQYIWEQIEAGSTFAFAMDDNGDVYGWGNNLYGQLGFYSKDLEPEPVLISGNLPILQISAAKGMLSTYGIYGLHTLIIREDSTFCSAGANYIGQLGIGTVNNDKTKKFICEEPPLSINSYNIDFEEISIFPNPARSQFTITNTENATIELFNILGQKIKQISSKEENTVIHTQNLPIGIYLLKVKKGDTVIAKKVQIIE